MIQVYQSRHSPFMYTLTCSLQEQTFLCRCVSRCTDGGWIIKDSNLGPIGYEPTALTI